MKLGMIGLPSLSVSELPPTDSGYHRSILGVFHDAVDTHPLAIELADRLLRDVRAKELEGSSIFNGSAGLMYSSRMLIAWWLWRANLVGVETANENLESFLTNERASYLLSLWVYGIEVDETIRLSKKFRVVPFSEMPLSWEQADTAQSKIRSMVDYRPLQLAAIVAEFSAAKIFGADDSSQEDISNDRQVLAAIALLLNAIPGLSCSAGFSTGYTREDTPPGPFGGHAGSKGLVDILPASSGSKFEQKHVSQLLSLLRGFSGLSPSWQERMSRSLARLGQSKARFDHNDAALDLGIALEMVLLHSEHKGTKLPGQLHNHFRSRGAWLLGKSYEERHTVYKHLGQIYSKRSQVAHNGVIDGNASDIVAAARKHTALAEEILRKLIVEGPPSDWSELVLGGHSEP